MRLIDPLTTVHGTLAHHGLPAALWRRRPETNVPSGRRDVLLFSITVETSQTESLSIERLATTASGVYDDDDEDDGL